jgi:hypothetical protein
LPTAFKAIAYCLGKRHKRGRSRVSGSAPPLPEGAMIFF